MATAIMKQKEVPEMDDVEEIIQRYQKTVLTNGVRHKREPG